MPCAAPRLLRRLDGRRPRASEAQPSCWYEAAAPALAIATSAASTGGWNWRGRWALEADTGSWIICRDGGGPDGRGLSAALVCINKGRWAAAEDRIAETCGRQALVRCILRLNYCSSGHGSRPAPPTKGSRPAGGSITVPPTTAAATTASYVAARIRFLLWRINWAF